MIGNGAGCGTQVPSLAIVALLACGLFTTIGLFSPGLVLPQLARDFANTPHAELLTELVGTLASFAFAVGAPFAGGLIARLGCRRVIVPSLCLFAIFGAAPALLADLWLILIARIGLGLALAGIFTGALTGLGATSTDLRMRLFGWFSMVGGGAAILLFPLVGALGHLGWRPAFLVNLSALLVVPLALRLPASLGVAVAPAGGAEAGARGGLITPAIAGLLIIAALAGMGMLIGPIYAPIYLSTIGITDTRLLAVPVTIGSFAAVAASALYGRAHRRLGLSGVSALALVTMGIALVVCCTTDGIVLFTAAVVIHSAMTALVAPNVSAAALAWSRPGKGAQTIGLANGMMFGAQLAFPFLATWIRGMAGLPGVFLVFGGTIGVIGLVIALRAARGRARRPVTA